MYISIINSIFKQKKLIFELFTNLFKIRLVMSETKFIGHTSIVKNGDNFESVKLCIARAMIPNLSVGVTNGTIADTFVDKFKMYLAIGVPTITSQFLEYKMEVTETEINFYGFTDTTVRLAFAILYKDKVTDRKLTMIASKALTFISRPVAEEIAPDGLGDSLNIFGIDAGDY